MFATDPSGLVVWEASYLPFGGVDVPACPALDLRFPGQWFQAESGLHQNWMRDYDPTTGRDKQADPLALVDWRRCPPQVRVAGTIGTLGGVAAQAAMKGLWDTPAF